MSTKASLVILLFIIADAIRTIIMRSAFLSGAEIWSFILSATLVSIAFNIVTIGIKYRHDLLELVCKRHKALLIVILINTWHFGLAGTLYIVSNKYVPAPAVGMLIQFVILFSTLWERIFFKEKQSRSFWLLLFGNLVGLYLITNSGESLELNYYYLIPITAAFCFSITDNFSRHYLNKELVKAEVMAFFRPIGFIFFMPVLFAINSLVDIQLDFSGLFESNLLLHIISGGVCMSLVWIFINKAYKLTSVSNLCMFAMTKPILILILSAIFLGEYFNFIQSIGAALIIVSSFIFIYLKKQIKVKQKVQQQLN